MEGEKSVSDTVQFRMGGKSLSKKKGGSLVSLWKETESCKGEKESSDRVRKKWGKSRIKDCLNMSTLPRKQSQCLISCLFLENEETVSHGFPTRNGTVQIVSMRKRWDVVQFRAGEKQALYIWKRNEKPRTVTKKDGGKVVKKNCSSEEERCRCRVAKTHRIP